MAASLGPVEIEQQITIPVEAAVSGLPGLENVRSLSKFGLSQVTATFHDGVELYLARQLISERLGTVELPAGIERPRLGPVTTGLGEVFHYAVTGKGDNPPSLEALTTLHDWVIRPQLVSVDGVAEVNTWGGGKKQFQVQLDPVRLIKYDLTLDELTEALRENNTSVGGGYMVQGGEAHIVHDVALTTTLSEIGSASCASVKTATP